MIIFYLLIDNLEAVCLRFVADICDSFSYLDLLGTFRKLVGLKKTELSTARNRTKIGLDKVRSNSCAVLVCYD